MAGLPNRYIAGVTVDPANPAHAYAVFNGYSRRFIPGGGIGHVFETINGGQSWTDISGNLPDIASDALVLEPRPAGPGHRRGRVHRPRAEAPAPPGAPRLRPAERRRRRPHPGPERLHLRGHPRPRRLALQVLEPQPLHNETGAPAPGRSPGAGASEKVGEFMSLSRITMLFALLSLPIALVTVPGGAAAKAATTHATSSVTSSSLGEYSPTFTWQAATGCATAGCSLLAGPYPTPSTRSLALGAGTESAAPAASTVTITDRERANAAAILAGDPRTSPSPVHPRSGADPTSPAVSFAPAGGAVTSLAAARRRQRRDRVDHRGLPQDHAGSPALPGHRARGPKSVGPAMATSWKPTTSGRS